MTAPGVTRRISPESTAPRLPALVTPAYGSANLSDLMPSIGAHLGVPGCADDVLGLPAGERFVVVLVDGLGWNLVRRAVRDAPYLASLLGDARPITSAVPSTTVTSLASLGTGLVPGQHGMVGYTSRVPSTGEILNALTWESDLLARVYQPRPTIFERAAAAGVSVSSVTLERFEESGLTQAVLRGPEFVPYAEDSTAASRIELTVNAAMRGERSIVYDYERELDHVGHAQGCESEAWHRQLDHHRRPVRAAPGGAAGRGAPGHHRRSRDDRHPDRAAVRGRGRSEPDGRGLGPGGRTAVSPAVRRP